MKKTITFIFLVTFFTIPTLLVFAQSTSTQAEGTSTGWHLTQGEGGCMEIELPFIPKCGATPASYLSGLYRLALGLGVLAALIMIVVAGITYATSGDNASKQKEARGQIKDAIIGMVILFASVLILRTINPDLVSMRLEVQFPSSPTPATSTGKISKDVQQCINSCIKDTCDKYFVKIEVVGDLYKISTPVRQQPQYDICAKACENFCNNPMK
ncbi:MAG: pilin [Candidatus Pacebacteria bacterium]|nr:pilin [Candidatus Paceibacterota bacterium]